MHNFKYVLPDIAYKDFLSISAILDAKTSEERINILTENKDDVNSRGRCHWTPLGIASSLNDVELAQWLIQKGANLIIGDETRPTIFMAAQLGHLEILSLLHGQHNVDLNISAMPSKDTTTGNIPENYSPLMIAARNGHIEVVKYLLNHGAKFSLTGSVDACPITLINTLIDLLEEEAQNPNQQRNRALKDLIGTQTIDIPNFISQLTEIGRICNFAKQTSKYKIMGLLYGQAIRNQGNEEQPSCLTLLPPEVMFYIAAHEVAGFCPNFYNQNLPGLNLLFKQAIEEPKSTINNLEKEREQTLNIIEKLQNNPCKF